jgi:hypothetical protein
VLLIIFTVSVIPDLITTQTPGEITLIAVLCAVYLFIRVTGIIIGASAMYIAGDAVANNNMISMMRAS